MNGFFAMFRKEVREQLRTLRAPVVLGLLVLIGLISPVLAKATPEIISRFASSEISGMELLMLREPDAGDALLQYQKNFGLMPLVVILLAMGAVSGEKRRGTASLLVVKPLSRRAFVLAKATSAGLLYLLGTVMAAAGCLLYTRLLFGELALPGFLLLNGLLLLTLWCYLAITLLGSVAFSSQAAAAGLGIGALAVFSLLGLVPVFRRLTPAGLSQAVVDLIVGREVVGLGTTVAASALLTLAALVLAERIFVSQEL